jgi:hypothetical protein
MNVIERAKNMLLQPTQTWAVVDAEPASVASIYKDWLVIMAAIPAVCGFIGLSIVGVGMFGYGYRVPIGSGIAIMVTGYLLSLAAAFIMSLIVDALAPNFGGTKNQVGALKVVAYGAAAIYAAGVFKLMPALGLLGILAACYSIYLMYLGLPVVMKCPPEKAAGYTAVVVVIYIVVMVVVGGLTATLGGFGAIARGLP